MKKTKYRITYSSKFDRDYRKLVRGNKGLSKTIIKAIKQLSIDPFYPSLRTHTVNISSFGKVYSSRVTGDLRIIWNFNGDIIVLQRIGGHFGSSKIC